MKNLELHLELVKQEKDLSSDETTKLIKGLLKSHMFHFRAYNTQQRYLNLYVSDPNYMTPELREEKEVSAIFAEQFKRIPKGHHFLPARPFPPMRIPEGEEVPYPPEPFCVWKDLPIEDFIYDEDHDEFVLPKGYVNEEMRIDDQSVVWDWENNTVTMKFIDGDAVTWPFWKPKDTMDMLKEGDWCLEYLQRMYDRYLHDIDPPGMRPGDD